MRVGQSVFCIYYYICGTKTNGKTQAKLEALGERKPSPRKPFSTHSSSTVHIVLNCILVSYNLFRCDLAGLATAKRSIACQELCICVGKKIWPETPLSRAQSMPDPYKISSQLVRPLCKIRLLYIIPVSICRGPKNLGRWCPATFGCWVIDPKYMSLP